MQNEKAIIEASSPGFRTEQNPILPANDPPLDAETFAGIRKILRAAEAATGMALSVVDTNGKFLLKSEKQHFCLDFAHRECPELKAKCEAALRFPSGNTPLEKHEASFHESCPLGIRELKVTVKHQGKVCCCIIGGGVVTDQIPRDRVCDRLGANGCRIPYEKLLGYVDSNLPIVEAWKIDTALDIVTGVASLLEEFFKARWERTKLNEITKTDAIGRRLISDAGSTQPNPLQTMSNIAHELARAVHADACCVWVKDSDKAKLFPLITSGFSELDVLKLPAVDLETSLTGRVLQTGHFERVEDLIQHNTNQLPLRDSLLQMGFSTLLCVPVTIDKETPAAITAYRKHSVPFDLLETELLSELAPHMWESINKAEITRYALAQAEVMRMLNSDKDSGDFYDQIACKVRDWLGAAACSIFFQYGSSDEIELRGTTGVEGTRQGRRYKRGYGLTGWVWETGKTLRLYHCEDKNELAKVNANLDWSHSVLETGQDRLEKGAMRSVLACPIVVADKICGVVRVCVASASRSVFSKEDEQLLSAIAEQLGVAWKRFRLGEDVGTILQNTQRFLADVLEVHQAVVRMFDDKPTGKGVGPMQVVSLAFEKIMKRDGNWKWVSLRIPHGSGQRHLKYFLTGGEAGKKDLESIEFPIEKGHSLGADCFLDKEPIRCPDISKDKRYRCPLNKYGARSCYNLALVVSGKSIGVLSVDSVKLSDFDERATHYLALLAAQLATAFTLASSIDALRDADKQKQAHLEAMAHQLIAPLAAIRTSCESLLGGRTTAIRTAVRLNKALISLAAQSRIASRTASNFGILADLLVGRTTEAKMRKSRQNIVRLVIDLARDFQPMAWANEKNILVRVHGRHANFRDPDFGFQDAILADYDEGAFPQVVGNVIENAVKYSHDFTRVIVNVEEAATCVRVQVTSEGIKLAKDEKEKIFGPAYRTTEARRKYPPGTGIGLPIARSIMHAHNGRLFALPTDEKGRTMFVIELPK